MSVYIVIRIYSCGWKCSKASYDLPSLLPEICSDVIRGVYTNGSNALVSAYYETRECYLEKNNDEERIEALLKYPDLTSETDVEIRTYLNNLKVDVATDDHYYYCDIIEKQVLG